MRIVRGTSTAESGRGFVREFVRGAGSGGFAGAGVGARLRLRSGHGGERGRLRLRGGSCDERKRLRLSGGAVAGRERGVSAVGFVAAGGDSQVESKLVFGCGVSGRGRGRQRHGRQRGSAAGHRGDAGACGSVERSDNGGGESERGVVGCDSSGGGSVDTALSYHQQFAREQGSGNDRMEKSGDLAVRVWRGGCGV